MNADFPRIFISYSTRDGSDSASHLRRRLEDAGFAIWQDLVGLRGGHDWWSQIEDTLRARALEHLVLVVSDSALERPVIRQEVRLARQEGVQVTPVRATNKLDFTNVPRWLGHVLDLDKPEHWQVLVNTLASPSQQNRVPIMAPEPPVDFVARPVEYEALKLQLIDKRGDSVAITAALKGAGGYGKTTLAKALAHDPDVQTAYFDGILWVELGEKPNNLQAIITDLVKILTGKHRAFETLDAAVAVLVEALGNRRILFIIDDAWREKNLQPFLQGGSNTTRLVTTRLDNILPNMAFHQSVDAMTPREAGELISWGLPVEQALTEATVLKGLNERLGEWALLVKLVNGFLRQRVERSREPLASAIKNVNKRLDARGLTAFDANSVEGRSKAVSRTINVSLELLDETQQQRFIELGIFPEDADIPIGVVKRLWLKTGGLDEIETEDLLLELVNLSLLLDLDLELHTLRLHDVMRHFQRSAAGEEGLRSHESQLVAAMGDIGDAKDLNTPELKFYLPLLLYYSWRAQRWDQIIKSFSEKRIFEKLPPITYGAAYSPGLFHGLSTGTLLPIHLQDLEAADRKMVGEAIANALSSSARRYMKAAQSYPQPWNEVADKFRREDEEEFTRYRDSFYIFATLAELSANWALAAFADADAEAHGRGQKFLEANSDMVSFLNYLANFGAGATGLSRALEDNLAGPSHDAWQKFRASVSNAT